MANNNEWWYRFIRRWLHVGCIHSLFALFRLKHNYYVWKDAVDVTGVVRINCNHSDHTFVGKIRKRQSFELNRNNGYHYLSISVCVCSFEKPPWLVLITIEWPIRLVNNLKCTRRCSVHIRSMELMGRMDAMPMYHGCAVGHVDLTITSASYWTSFIFDVAQH